jgi:DNA-binding XRE family transcriptional regulator
MKRKLIDYKRWRNKALKDPNVRKAYKEADDDPFIEVSTQLIRLREKNHLTQAKLAKKLHTSQQAVARLESVTYRGYSLQTLEKIAHTFNKRLSIQFL